MTAPASIVDAVMSLPLDERADLALQLVESLEEADDHDTDVDAAWSEEVVRRVEAVQAGRVTPIPFEEALGKARGRIRCM